MRHVISQKITDIESSLFEIEHAVYYANVMSDGVSLETIDLVVRSTVYLVSHEGPNH